LLLLVGLTHLARLTATTSTQDLHLLLQRFLPPGTALDTAGTFYGVERFLVGFARARGVVSLYAAPLFLWFGTRLFASVRTALTLVYDSPRGPRHILVAFLTGKLRDGMMVLLTLALLVGNAALTAALKVANARGHELVKSLPSLRFFVTGLGQLLAELLAFAFSISLFYLVYRHASPRRLLREAAFAGSLLTAVLFEVAKRLYGWYLHHMAVVNRFSADASTGAALLFVLWLYYTALVFLIGAVVAETWDLWTRQRNRPGFGPVQLAG
jgi:uncharacterized BrkB/YihY/UPF0761 family membrane protein